MPIWDQLYVQGVALVEPLPLVVRAIDALKRAGAEKILDLGCGTGRHLALLGRHGFAVWGVDIAPHGLERCRELLEAEGIAGNLALAEMRAIPFAAGAFDAVLSTHVLYHASRSGMQAAMREIFRVLPAGGLFLGTLLSTRTWKYGEGHALEEDTFVQARGPEAGVPHHYCDEAEARTLLGNFTLVDLHLDEFLDGAGDRQSHWEFLARRG